MNGELQPIDTLDGLIAAYRNDGDSRYSKLRFHTRVNYDNLCARLSREHGGDLLSDMRARAFLRWLAQWTHGGHVAMAHGLMGMLRTLIGFGTTILELRECERLTGILHGMRFKMPKSRSERLTADQVEAIRAHAHEAGRPSIALAQALQFELMLRQKDVIGEWVPVGEPGASEIIDDDMKWLRGLRWSEIDRDLIVRHTTSKRGKDIEVDLKLAPMAMRELARVSNAKPGPIIISETTGFPWRNYAFRRQWRTIARAAGVPDRVLNMDTRAGAISEATDAGADLEHVRHAATHTDISMTQRYSRGTAEKIAKVQQARVAHRALVEVP